VRANVTPTIILALNKSEAVRALGLGRHGLTRIAAASHCVHRRTVSQSYTNLIDVVAVAAHHNHVSRIVGGGLGFDFLVFCLLKRCLRSRRP
jgi:hypothetical protein